MPESTHESADTTMRRINRLWVSGDVEALTPLVHPEIVMVFPGFTGRIQGREEFLAGFRDFCQNAKISDFSDYDYEVDVAGHTAVITFQYVMVYERSGDRYHVTGRDLWVFEDEASKWIAVWRTMLDVEEKAV